MLMEAFGYLRKQRDDTIPQVNERVAFATKAHRV